MTGASGAGRLALAFSAFGLAALLVSPAAAQTELLPGDQVAEDAVEIGNPIKKAKKLVKRVADEADELLDEAEEEVYEVVEQADETIEQVKEDVEHVVDSVELPGSPEQESPKHSVPPKSHAGSGGARNERVPRVKGSARGDALGRAGAERELVVPHHRVPRLPPRLHAASAAGQPPAAAPVPPAEVAQRFAFPLVMTAAVIAFLVFQGRFDRRDAKLQFHLDLDGERLSFE